MVANAPPLLLLSHVPPGNAGAGQLWMRDICVVYPRDRLAYVYDKHQEDSWSPNLKDISSLGISFPYEFGWFRQLGRFAHYVRWLYELRVNSRSIPQIIRRTVDFGHQYKVQRVLATLHGPTVMKIALPVARQLGIPLSVLVWDPPEYILTNYRLDRLTRMTLLRTFAATLRAADRCGVMSEAMEQDYRLNFSARTVVMHHAVPRSLWKVPTATNSEKVSAQPLVIAFSGTIYSREEFKALLTALGNAQWFVGGSHVKLRIFAPDLKIDTSLPLDIEYLGWRSLEDTINLLSQCDIAYLPYRFHADFAEAARLSFPTKLSTYLAAGLPILYHGPEQSPVVNFLRDYQVGITCHSLEASEILSKLIHLKDNLINYKKAAHTALENQLNAENFRQQTADLLNIDSDCLLPLSS